MWSYRNGEFSSEMIGDYVGFVYVITDLVNRKKYVGKKLFKSTRRLAPLKGKTRKRKVVKESDWQDYFGSSEEVKMLVEKEVENLFIEKFYIYVTVKVNYLISKQKNSSIVMYYCLMNITMVL